MKKQKIRPLGTILLDMEYSLEEMVDGHDLQVSDLLGLIHYWAVTHRPECVEEYIDGSRPVLYTHPSSIKKLKKLLKKRKD